MKTIFELAISALILIAISVIIVLISFFPVVLSAIAIIIIAVVMIILIRELIFGSPNPRGPRDHWTDFL